MPFAPYDSFADEAALPPVERAQDLIEWQDVGHLADFGTREKSFVQAFQKKRGLPVTAFD